VATPPGWRLSWRPALAVAASLVAALGLLPGRAGHEPSVRPLPAWTALPPAAEDSSFALLEGLAVESDDLVTMTSQRGVAGLVAGLSDAERQELAKALQAELRGGQS
jgi:hypothetical protein